MDAPYQDPKAQARYLKYLASKEAMTEQELIFAAQEKLLPQNPQSLVLDAACGAGWLAGKLAGKFKHVYGVDQAAALVDLAKKKFPVVEFAVADLTLGPLPFAANSFDAVILNMAAHDIAQLDKAFKNLHAILKPGGQFLMTVANPYYAYPVGVWKRGFFRFLFGLMPKLRLRPYNKFARAAKRAFTWKKSIPSYFYSLPEYLTKALNTNFVLTHFQEISSDKDSSIFDRHFQLYRFPLVLLLEFKKPAE